MVSISVRFLRRGGRKQIITPPGFGPWSPTPRVDAALLKIVVRAHRRDEMLESGENTSAADLFKAEKVIDSYLNRILRLTLLAPAIVQAIVEGKQPQLYRRMTCSSRSPAEWEAQKSLLAMPHGRTSR
jgi:hypothetical protein